MRSPRLGKALCGGGRLLGPRAGEPALRRADSTHLPSHIFGLSSFATHSLTLADSLIVVPNLRRRNRSAQWRGRTCSALP